MAIKLILVVLVGGLWACTLQYCDRSSECRQDDKRAPEVDAEVNPNDTK